MGRVMVRVLDECDGLYVMCGWYPRLRAGRVLSCRGGLLSTVYDVLSMPCRCLVSMPLDPYSDRVVVI